MRRQGLNCLIYKKSTFGHDAAYGEPSQQRRSLQWADVAIEVVGDRATVVKNRLEFTDTNKYFSADNISAYLYMQQSKHKSVYI